MNDSVVLSGSLGFLPLGDIIQLLGSSGSTGVLRLISRYAPDPGFIYFIEGNPVNAQKGDMDGLDALYSLFGWVNGSFEFTRGAILADKRINKSRMGIILEGLKLLDDGLIKKVGPATAANKTADMKRSLSKTAIVKGPLVDYMYVVDEEDFFDGEHIVEEGKHGSWMWVILEGVVDIVKEVESGTIPIIRIGDGCFIGSMASFLLQGHIRTASAVAVGNVQLGVLDSQRLAQEYAGMSLEFRTFLTSVDKRFKQLTDRIVEYHDGKVQTADILKDKKVLIQQGKTENEQLYVVKQGRGSVVRKTENGPVMLCHLYQGDFFGDVPFLHLGQEPEEASIYGSENIKITKIEAASLQTEYNRLSTTFKNIVANMATCMSVTADMVCSSLTSKKAAPADSNIYHQDKGEPQ
ncbi:MAG: cyclic nucleotide-binding domain-containing protein [Desulfosarcina sp.]|nr:cyclic nucleotide-binding domain-containing protein [Desulfosarcina sp.]MBC2741966.1 cyclic nucleotide-binding domain-containing protein [Desulfosarcina sp.]MBC2764879.1 cyclic nucleotide-binding domain-containing protein [Desulfosarcina sp.]